eukprot:symbB.v1.2.032228.t1/scaffold3839.1/size96963/7
MGDLPLQIKSAKVYSGAHPAVYKFNGKKFEDLIFDDYKLKSQVFFEWQDISGIETIGGFLSEDETIDVLTDFRERFSGLKNFESEGNLTLMCEEDLNLLDTITPNNPCEMLPRSNICCCLENDLLKAGENVCLKVNGAETEQTIIRNRQWGSMDFDMGFAANAPDWIEVTDPKSQEKIQYKKLNQISFKTCVAWEIREVRKTVPSYVQMNVQKTLVMDRKYCTSFEVKLKCPAGHVMYENVPGSELTREYACKAGLKNNVPGDPDFASKCKCHVREIWQGFEDVEFPNAEVDGMPFGSHGASCCVGKSKIGFCSPRCCGQAKLQIYLVEESTQTGILYRGIIMEVERRLNKCMNYSCYYPVLEVQQFEHFKGIFRLLGWLFPMEKLRVDCGYTHTRLAPDLRIRLAKSQSQLACDIKSQRVKSNQMRFIFGWIAVLCLGADALWATLKENWQDKLTCEC